MSNNGKVFIGAQQSELNAVLMYREFAKRTKNEELKQLFLEAAADEGNHAAILSKYTNRKLQPQKFQAKMLGIAFRLFPKKLMFFAISKGEYAGGNAYKPYVKDYPEFEKMMKDEYRHGETFAGLIKKKM